MSSGDWEKSVKRRVLEHLTDHADEVFSAKILALQIKANYENVKKALSRMYKEGLINRLPGGFYQCQADLTKIRAQEIPPLEVHGIKIELDIDIFKCPFVPAGLLSGTFNQVKNHRVVYKLDFRKRAVTISHCSNGLIEIFVKGKPALSYDEFLAFTDWLDGLFTGAGWGFWGNFPRIKQLGINRDYIKVRLGKVKDLSLQYFKNCWVQIYDKKGQTRIEDHSALDIGLPEALKIIQQLQDPIKYKPDMTKRDGYA